MIYKAKVKKVAKLLKGLEALTDGIVIKVIEREPLNYEELISELEMKNPQASYYCLIPEEFPYSPDPSSDPAVILLPGWFAGHHFKDTEPILTDGDINGFYGCELSTMLGVNLIVGFLMGKGIRVLGDSYEGPVQVYI